jgi:Serine aminopeptidase, S33
MSHLRRLLVEPFFRVFYGRPLEDGIPPEEESAPEQRAARPVLVGLVVTAGGVGGFDLSGTALRYILGASGVPYAIHVFPWGHGLGRWFADLTDVLHREAQAALLAQAVRQFKSRHADIPVFLVGKSGGSAVVIQALEQLEDSSVERAILLAPAMSPDYDLTPALRAVSRELVVFWSPLDILLLGLGTRVFGTADRIRTASAGLRGFRVPQDAPGAPADLRRTCQYAKLRQIKWSARMMAAGHLGGHFGADSPVFLKKYVLPLLRTEPADPR